MRQPSARILRNRVSVQPTLFFPDDDGGRQIVLVGTPSAPIACRVHPASSRDVPEHMREEGVEYLTVHFFGSDPGVKIRYLIHWLDFSPAKVMSVIGPARTAAGELATWLVDCEYRVPPTTGGN